MTDTDRTPDASADVRERAAATEDYGGVPISDQEMAEVWIAPEGEEASGSAQFEGSDRTGSKKTESDTAEADTAESDTVESADPGDAGDTKPEVPQDDPQPVEPA
jgi:hypothetical protein